MKIKLGLLLITLVVPTIHVFGQTRTCETVYKTVDMNPTFEGGMNQLMDYSTKYLTPIISKYHDKDKELTGKMTMTLTIDADGKVVDAELSNHKLPKDCEVEIRKQLLTMIGWTPAILNGQKVCSKFAWIISGIKWG